MLSRILTATAVLASMSSGSAFANSIYEDWDDGSLDGWTALGTPTVELTGGVGNSPYLRVVRSSGGSPQASAGAAASGGGFVGDYGALYGSPMVISFAAREFSDIFSLRLSLRTDVTTTPTLWNLDLGNPTTDWTTYKVLINPNWTDAEATSHGWAQVAGAQSWADTLSSIEVFAIDTAASSLPGTLGVDNASLSAVPEPSTYAMALIAVVGTGLYRRRRRSGRALRHNAATR